MGSDNMMFGIGTFGGCRCGGWPWWNCCNGVEVRFADRECCEHDECWRRCCCCQCRDDYCEERREDRCEHRENRCEERREDRRDDRRQRGSCHCCD